ncbi:hypothetical protein [Bradyrhizobium sp.]|uniref:hypothetical protein n=1 Tax=Bradyrhizobium sp. TaxID=376 RepID=UPI002B5A66BE|nr:hypothetical protein [Bradyrhizobium sp.]HMM90972.1 hypothetical protein [Bradyrhizobium sp.]
MSIPCEVEKFDTFVQIRFVGLLVPPDLARAAKLFLPPLVRHLPEKRRVNHSIELVDVHGVNPQTTPDESGDGETAALATFLGLRGAALIMMSRLHEALRDLSEVIEIWAPGERSLSDSDATSLALTLGGRHVPTNSVERICAQSAIDNCTPFAERGEDSRASLSNCLNRPAWLQAMSPASNVRDGKKGPGERDASV